MLKNSKIIVRLNVYKKYSINLFAIKIVELKLKSEFSENCISETAIKENFQNISCLSNYKKLFIR